MDIEKKLTIGDIVFNDFSDPQRFFLLENFPENDSPPDLSQGSAKRSDAHGVFHSRSFYGKRFLVLSGAIVSPNQSERVEMEQELRNVFVLPRADDSTLAGFLDLTLEDEDGITKTARGKLVSGVHFTKIAGDSLTRDFSLTLELEKYFWESAEKTITPTEIVSPTNFKVIENTAPTLVGGFTLQFEFEGFALQNAGNHAAAPFVRIFGPVLNPSIHNDTTGKAFEIETELLDGEKLEIDTENGIVMKIDEEGAETDLSASITAESEWVFFELGENRIRIEDATLKAAGFSADIFWKDAYV